MKFHLLAFACALTLPLSADTIFGGAADSSWHYFAVKDSLPADWTKPGFDDAKWTTGPAPLGYGETRLKTVIPADGDKKPLTVAFRKTFTAPKLAEGDILTFSICFDDGAVIYVNGAELGRANMKPGPVQPADFAARDVSDRSEGLYYRIRVPAKLLKPDAPNVLAVEIHQSSATSDDLFFDGILRSMVARWENPKVTPEMSKVIDAFFKGQCIPAGMTVTDGYLDGGHAMKIDEEGKSSSGREIIVVDRKKDVELQKHIAYAKRPELQKLPPQERAVALADYVEKITTPPGGLRLVGPEVERFTQEFTNKPLLIGEIVEQCSAGVCRHRSLLYKILADEAGLKVALVRGLATTKVTPQGGAHAWNELILDDGKHIMVDVMNRAAKWNFHEVSDPAIVEMYRRFDHTAWYEGAKAAPAATTATPSAEKPAAEKPAGEKSADEKAPAKASSPGTSAVVK